MTIKIIGRCEIDKTLVLKYLCYDKYSCLRLRKIGMQPINELYQFISNHKAHLTLLKPNKFYF